MSVTNTNDSDEARRRSCFHCLTTVLDRIGNKWTIQIVASLSMGPKRFNAISRSVEGVSQRMLTLTLRDLERDGLVTRTVHATKAPHVEYELTPLGLTLTEPLTVLCDWAKIYLPEMEAAARVFEQRKEGSACAETGDNRALS